MPGLADDHVVAVGVIGHKNHDVARAAGARTSASPLVTKSAVELPGREGVHRRGIVEPLELDVDARLLEPAFVDRDLPGHPSRPVAVTEAQGGRFGAADEASPNSPSSAKAAKTPRARASQVRDHLQWSRGPVPGLD